MSPSSESGGRATWPPILHMFGTHHPVLDDHRQALRATFIEWFLEHNPREVLDLGAGDGALVAALGSAGVTARGIEKPGMALDRALELGRPIEPGDLGALEPGIPGSRWITIRHVLHHLADPQRLVGRATSAATTGVLLAEPISTTGLPMHAWTARLEALTRQLDRADGRIHGPDLSPAELVEMLPPDWKIEVRIQAPMTSLPADEVRQLIEGSARGRSLTPDESREADELIAAAMGGLVAPSGSVMVMGVR